MKKVCQNYDYCDKILKDSQSQRFIKTPFLLTQIQNPFMKKMHAGKI